MTFTEAEDLDHFDQGDRLPQSCKRRQQNGTVPGLVGLGASDRHQVAEIILVANDEGAEGAVVRRHAGQILHGTEEEIRLALDLGKCPKEGKDVRVLGDSERELLVQGRLISHFSFSELSVPSAVSICQQQRISPVPHVSEMSVPFRSPKAPIKVPGDAGVVPCDGPHVNEVNE